MLKVILLIAVIMAMGVWVPVFAAEGEINVQSSGQYVVTKDTVKGFLKLFKKAMRNGSQVNSIDEEAQAYIRSCCNDIDAISQLLNESGFEVHVTSDGEGLAELNRKLSRPGTYDQVISGMKRQAGWWPFWDYFTRYHIVVSIKSGRLVWVSAWTVTDFI